MESSPWKLRLWDRVSLGCIPSLCFVMLFAKCWGKCWNLVPGLHRALHKTWSDSLWSPSDSDNFCYSMDTAVKSSFLQVHVSPLQIIHVCQQNDLVGSFACKHKRMDQSGSTSSWVSPGQVHGSLKSTSCLVPTTTCISTHANTKPEV